MKQVQLEVKERQESGTGACNRLRKEGFIPAVVYGKSGSRSLAVDRVKFRDLMRASKGSATLVQLADDKGEQTLSFIQNIHREPTKDTFVHIDFHEISKDQPMHATLPVHIVGESKGVKNENGILEVQLHHLDVKGLPAALPEYIEVDISDLGVGEAIHIKDLTSSKEVAFLGNEDSVIASCSEARKVADEEPAAEGEEAAAEAPAEGEAKEEPAKEEEPKAAE